MSNIADIQNVVKSHLAQFDFFFEQQLKSPVPLLRSITNYIYRRKGKQLRPLTVFLCAQLNGRVGKKTHVGATMVELLHSATLMHDDVVDEAYERRGAFSINALWRSKAAVLAGDFLLSQGLLVALENNSEDLLRIVSNAIRSMSEGELQQMDKAQRLDCSEELYFEIIHKKTAALIQACAEVGAASVGAAQEHLQAMQEFGQALGMAFQLRDDVLDYHSNLLTGKTAGNDIKEKKVTLPLIHALSQVNMKGQGQIISLVLGAKQKRKNIAQVINFVQQHKGIEYAEKITQDYCFKAKSCLANFPESEAKTALLMLTDYIGSREK
ncbi:MAG: polyprenyl synthetase family protein [Prevotellaceae bacterium]|jgi:octaprenyl-diphosphate synthase|nr:polyprenyl synthetase family protein [Prevotellaceae bacterium]